MWRPWYAAVWAEAAVVTGHPDAVARIRRARLATLDNPVAAAIVARAAALAGDRDGLVPAAAALAAAGCRYQWARTLVAIGGADRDRGEAVLADLGATVMAWLQDEVERGLGGPAHAAEAGFAQYSAQPSLALRAEPRPTSWARDPGVQITVDRP